MESPEKRQLYAATFEATINWCKDVITHINKSGERKNLWATDSVFNSTFSNNDSKLISVASKLDRVKFYHMVITAIQMLSTVRGE
jgi:hypothetical protein